MALIASKSHSMVPNGTEEYPFLIELTAKRWKGLILLAFVLTPAQIPRGIPIIHAIITLEPHR